MPKTPAATPLANNDWFRVGDFPPPLNVLVRLRWNGIVVIGRRLVARRDGKRVRGGQAWEVAASEGKLIDWPREGDETLWGLAPEHWQPIDISKWRAPLPKEAAVIETGAAEPIPVVKTLLIRRDWWRDERPKCSERGHITPREAEGRVMRALMSERALPEDDLGSETPTSTWLAKMIRFIEMIEGKRPSYWHGRFQPTAKDLSDLAEVAPWLATLAVHKPRLYRILELRALDPPWSFRAISAMAEFNCSSARVSQLHRDAILEVTAIANGRSRHGIVVLRDLLEEAHARRAKAAKANADAEAHPL